MSGIDTDAGKSYATGLLARMIREEKPGDRTVITQKLVQTGCMPDEGSEDILLHRKLMGIPLQPVDLACLTCTEIYRFPASPHLSAAKEGRGIDLERISEATDALSVAYDVVLVEGAGGLMVPLKPFGENLSVEKDEGGTNPQYLTIDYVREREMPVLFVTSARLGSLNHTLLSLEACRARGIRVAGVLFNRYPAGNAEISGDTWDYIRQYLRFYYPEARMIEIPEIVPATSK